MKKKICLVMFITGVLVLVFFYAHIDKNTYLYDRNVDSEDLIPTGILKEKEEIRQSFTCKEDSIDGINLKATVVGDVESVNIEYSLIHPESGDVVRSGSVKGKEIKNNRFNKLKFQVLEDTKDKKYVLKLSESGASGELGISFYMSAEKRPGEKLTVRENETQGVLVARILTYRFDWETFIVMLGILAFIAGFMSALYKLFK